MLANKIVSKAKTDQFGLGPFDPINMKTLNIDHKGETIQLNAQVRNFTLRGLSEVRFSKFKGFKKDFDKLKIEFNLFYPNISVVGKQVELLLRSIQ
jgi:hypothetical protein